MKQDRHLHYTFPCNEPTIQENQTGLSLLEVMVAMLLLTIASGMIYSMLNRSIFFAGKGENKSREIEEHYALVSLLQRQVQSGWRNPTTTRKVLISGRKDLLRLATATPFQARTGQVVMAFYRYNPEENTLYYLEKKDFYNPDYTELIPDYSDMMALITVPRGLSLDFDEESNTVTLIYIDQTYEFRPWCAPEVLEVS
ncbi:MAG: prepilin-type N-terminal cleavage/methylation domain-containing protein [Thermodesulfobacteriota bacterium]